jgi:hypothetical protein
MALAAIWVVFFVTLGAVFLWVYLRPFGFARRLRPVLLFQIRLFSGTPQLHARLPGIAAELSVAENEDALLSSAHADDWRRLRRWVRLVSGALVLLVTALLLAVLASALIRTVW